MTLAALFFWYLPQIQVSRQIRKEQEEAVEMYVREEKEENKEEHEKSEEVQEQEPGSTDKNLFRTIDFAGLRSKNREICAWLWIPGCALDVPVAHGQDNAYYLTHDAASANVSTVTVFNTTRMFGFFRRSSSRISFKFPADPPINACVGTGSASSASGAVPSIISR